MITNILSADITKYSDNGQTIASITWRDSRGQTATTSGDPNNLHMQALLTRAEREGVTIVRSPEFRDADSFRALRTMTHKQALKGMRRG